MVLCALGLITVVVGLLIAPAPYHRIVEHGRDDREFTSYVLRIMMIALLPFALSLGISLYIFVTKAVGSLYGIIVPLALGICGDFYVVMSNVSKSELLPIMLTILLLIFFGGLGFGLPRLRRR